MEKKNIDWSSLGFGYVKTDKRFVSNYSGGAWDDGVLTDDATITMSECACVLQYAQTCFEGMKAYTAEDGRIVCFRPDLNAARMAESCKRLKMPVYPEDKFVDAVIQTVRANAAWVPPFGSGATLYIRPFMFGYDSIIGVKPANEYQFRVFATPVGPYFKGGVKPLTVRISDLDRAAPRGTGHVKAGLNYAMSLYNIVDAHEQGYDENVYVDSATRTHIEETGGANIIFVKGNRLGDIGSAVQTYAESFGYGVVREYVGHGVGRKMHEDPEVPNFGHPGRGARLMPGMTIAIEPMINLKGEGVYTLDNDWTVVTESGSPSAHFEHTIAITDNGPVILTKL